MKFSAKISLAIILIVGIVLLAAKDIAPRLPMWQSLLIFVGISLLVLCSLFLASIFQFHINQYTLKKGGTDAQWLWFPGNKNPPGLQKLLDQREAKPEEDSHASASSRHTS